ncbi:nucleotide exchange factor GrpE [Rubellimicrobium rubrum]|uniref:Protein GrpE n=1 Tax=Rubellimicrobium rubrum TaxID=2585369 RepID=A0A5C4MQL7_9RHOB|nr:nucleotide exchange factor GrpE [Rubellimicrobium rubrum]TNC48152.1 nucleotide exchange factor GrpE [Rubellimicrobium rubrum]
MSDRPDPQTLASEDLRSLDDLAAEADAEEQAHAYLLAELDALRAEREDLKDRVLRQLAETENMRKRAERDRREAEQYGATRLARDLLPIYDNLRRALDAVTPEQREANAALLEGIDLTMREVVNVFSRHGITVIAPQVGDRFDPAVHQAMFEAPLPGTRAGDIIQVATEGFMLYDRLLRPAQVGVSSMPAS